MSLPPLFYCCRGCLQLFFEVDEEGAEVGEVLDDLHTGVFDGACVHLLARSLEGVATVERAGTKGEKRRRRLPDNIFG